MNLNKAKYQGYRNFCCTDCDFEFKPYMKSEKYIIGYGKTDNIKTSFGIVFECPNCFTKSWCHTILKESSLKLMMSRINKNKI